MRTVEIRWKEVEPDERLSDFNSYLKEIEDVDTPTAVEEVFSSWMKENIEGRKVIVSEFDIFVDGKYHPLERGNEAASRRRAFSLRLVGDDARYVERPGPTSPPFPGHEMVAGQRLREDWFPELFHA